ncbi:unnamed protein product [Porites lobata]|uniref:Fork-head domain-containing protein n=1 Tax=Porites lobata TaxID=104759 RepID=A0ABN8RS45_9CNID|nr:unnamed protein product [Porites lobata]
MFSIHSGRHEENSLDVSTYRFPCKEDERNFRQLPLSRLETQTNLSSRAMSKDVKVESSKGQTVRKKTRSISSSEDEDEDSTRESKESRNLSETFVAVIAQGILSVPSKRMTLSSIYNFISKRFPHFDKEKGPGWRNSVRHNLSSNDCFVKASRAENGKGHYWMIHPKDLPEFSKGNYRRPRKPRRPRCSHSLSCATDRGLLGLPISASLFPYPHKPPSSLDFSKPHSPETFSRPFGVTSPRYEYFSRAEPEAPRYPLNQFQGFSTPPPPYGFLWQDNSAFRNYSTRLQSSTFHPCLYMSPVAQKDNVMGINYA